jgi:hypothetical protein
MERPVMAVGQWHGIQSFHAAAQVAIILSGANVILEWPTNAAGFTMQSTTNLDSQAAWSIVSPGRSSSTGRTEFPIPSPAHFNFTG